MYQYAVDVMQGPVALGSDFNGVAGHVGPRFGYRRLRPQLDERGRQERAGNKLVYPFTLPGLRRRSTKQVTGEKTFDYNVDGLAHVGLLPDLVADLGRSDSSQQDLEPLFRSADGFVDVWERAEGNDPGDASFQQQLRCEDYTGADALSADATDVRGRRARWPPPATRHASRRAPPARTRSAPPT